MSLSRFQLSQQALRDLAKIRHRLQRKAGVRIADMVEEALLAGVAECERLIWIGHPRADVQNKSLLFHYVYEYAIIFQRQPDVVVLRVMHGARDIPKRLRKV